MAIVILGLGKTGQSLARYFLKKGEAVWGVDDCPTGDLEIPGDLTLSKTFLEGEMPPLNEVSRFFISPGVDPKHPVAQEAQKKGFVLEGELDLAQSLTQGKVIAITGTNGKSTTTALLGEILKTEGLPVGVGGNLGTPFLDLVQDAKRFTHFVVEVSSFQLESAKAFRPHVGILLNLSEDHLIRHPSMAQYLHAKQKIWENQDLEDFAVYNADDLHVLEAVEGVRAQLIPFSNAKKVRGAYGNEESLFWAPKEKVLSSFELRDCPLTGLHNLENMTAALAGAKILGVSDDSIEKTLKSFKGLPHRMEPVAQIDGVSYFDDSKATNVGAVVMSLASFDEKVILILGGVDKGGDYFPLRPLIKAKSQHVLVLGEARDKILKALENCAPMTPVANMEEAVAKAKELAQPGSTVLLSPACASFDMYRDYAERGRDFQKWVKTG